MGVLTAGVAGLLAVWFAVTAALVVLMVRHDRRVRRDHRALLLQDLFGARSLDGEVSVRPRCACGRYAAAGRAVIDRDGSEHTRHRCQPAREAIA